jgi:arylsulfatase A-like enzyme
LRAQFSSGAGFLEFVLRLSLLPVLPFILLGLLSGAFFAGLAKLSQLLLRRLGPRASSDLIFAWLCAAATSPYLAWVSSQIFTGPKAQNIPGRRLLAVALFLAALYAVRLLVELVRSGQRWAQGFWRRGALLGKLCVLFTLACHALDRFVLPRLYPWFHLSLELGATALVLIGAGFFLGAQRPAAPARRIAGPFTRRQLAGLAVVVVLAVLSGRSYGRLYRGTVLRSHVLFKTTWGAQLLRPYAAWKARSAGPRTPLPPTELLPAESPPPPYSGPRLEGRDVFLITVDALRYDRLNPQAMPFTSSLSQRGVVFDRAYTQVPHTSFAIATLLSGKPVYALLALGHEAASHETLPLVLRRFRYKTAAFYPPAVFYIERAKLKQLEDSAYGFEYVKYEYLPADRRTDQVMAFLESERPARAFVWVHYFEPHEPYEPHPGGPGAGERERYDGEVRYVDKEIERLCTYLGKTRPGALIIIAADHGEEFSEHGGRYHGTTLYEEQVHVPLVFAELTTTPVLKPRTLRQPVGLIDVAPTLLGLLDIERSARMRGRDLSPWLLSAASDLPVFPVFAEIGRQRMVELGNDKLICDLSTDTCQAFELRSDPAERRNLIDAEPTSARRLRGVLDGYLDEARRYEAAASPKQPGADDEATLARARLSDRGALPQLLSILGRPDAKPATRREALALLAELVATAPLAPQLDQAKAEALLRPLLDAEGDAPEAATPPEKVPGAVVQRRLAAVALLRLVPGEADKSPGSVQAVMELVGDERAEPKERLAGALTLATVPACQPHATGPKLDCVALWVKALPAVLTLEDPDAVRPLLQRLGESRDPRARLPLEHALLGVRSRIDVVKALGALHDRATVPVLAQLLSSDPYVHVRAAAATALGEIGGPGARAALVTAAPREHEAPVSAAITSALQAAAAPQSKSQNNQQARPQPR